MTKIEASKELQPNIEPKKQRHLAVDALRGFTMFWIMGGDSLFRALFRWFGGPFEKYLAPQLDHVAWEGFHFYDLIFPLFEFVVGMSVVFSLQKLLAEQGKQAAYTRIIKRFLLLYLLGVIYYGGISGGVDGIRLLGVLQRLALTYLFASILFIHLRLRGLILTFALLLLGYWAWLSLIPVPGLGEVSLVAGKNWANWVDMKYLPLFKWNGDWDPEGLLSTLPAIASCLLGVFASLLLLDKNILDMKKACYFIGGGIASVIIGYLWGIQFPVIKNIWTSSYVLVGGGYSFILLGIFYLLLDIWKIQKWALPFIWLGLNPITIYMVWNIMNFFRLAERIVGVPSRCVFGETIGFVLVSTLTVALVLALVRFLYNQKIFLRL
jgi:predicted acyltransferase